MTNIEKYCLLATASDENEREKTMNVLAERMLPVMRRFSSIDSFIYGALADIVMIAASADGKMTPRDYVALRPLLEKISGKKMDYAAVKSVVDNSRDYQNAAEKYRKNIIDTLGRADENSKEDLALLCTLACAATGEVSPKKRECLEKLFG